MTYARTKNDFLIRCVNILPDSLAKTTILPEIRDVFPDLHIADREFMCDLDDTAVIIDKTRALTDDEIITILASYIPDAIVADLPELSQRDADEIMTLVRKIDPPDSNVAAEIRDTLRDNYEEITI